MEDRFNSPSTKVVEIEVMNHTLRLAQDPNSQNVGTTVWDSSLVVAKYLEKNSRAGEFSRSKVTGKRCIELGAGCGLAGIGFALLGCDVVLTDQADVLPILKQNVDRNGSMAHMATSGDNFLGPIGKMDVLELDWGNAAHIDATNPPFDFIVGTDVVYVENMVEELFDTMLRLSHRRTVILLGYEFRSMTVHERLHALCRQRWNVKQVMRRQMDSHYQHKSIDLFVMKRKGGPLQPETSGSSIVARAMATTLVDEEKPSSLRTPSSPSDREADDAEAVKIAESCREEGIALNAYERVPLECAATPDSGGLHMEVMDGSEQSDLGTLEGENEECTEAERQTRVHGDWETRRAGAEAARLLASIIAPSQ